MSRTDPPRTAPALSLSLLGDGMSVQMLMSQTGWHRPGQLCETQSWSVGGSVSTVPQYLSLSATLWGSGVPPEVTADCPPYEEDYKWDPSASEGRDTLRTLPPTHTPSCYPKRNLSRDLSPIHIPAALYHPVPHRRCSHHTVSKRSKVSTEPLDIACHFSSPVPGVPTVGLCLPQALCHSQGHSGRPLLAIWGLCYYFY